MFHRVTSCTSHPHCISVTNLHLAFILQMKQTKHALWTELRTTQSWPSMLPSLLQMYDTTSETHFRKLQRSTFMLDIGHRLIEFAKCLFAFTVERTNVPLLSCQCSHCPIFFTCLFGDWLVARDPLNTATASFTLRWPLSSTGSHSLYLTYWPFAIQLQTLLHSLGRGYWLAVLYRLAWNSRVSEWWL